MSLSSGIRWLVLVLVAATALLVGGLLSWGFERQLREQHAEALEVLVGDRCDRIGIGLEAMRHDAELIAELESVARILAEREAGRRGSAEEARWKDSLARELEALLRSHPDYVQARLLGAADGGREVVRIDRAAGGVLRAPEDALQRKGEREYFLAGMATAPGETYVSDVELNREHGELSLPHLPVVRVAKAVPSSQEDAALLVVINVAFEGFLAGQLPTELSRYSVFVANDAGQFVHHPDPDKAFGFDLGFAYGLRDEFPDLPAPASDASGGALLDVGGGEGLACFRRVELMPGRGLLVGVEATYDDVARSLAAVRARTAGWTLGLLAVALTGAWAFSARLTRPLREITRAAERIGAGASDVELPTDSPAEAGTLARTFGAMLAKLREDEVNLVQSADRLRAANADLEHFAHVASHDLREPARRLQALSDLLQLEEEQAVSAEGRDLIARLQAEAGRMLAQISDLRTLVGVGRAELVRTTVDLSALVESVVDELRGEVVHRDVRLAVEDLPTLPLYEGLVTMLYRHLVANAFQHVTVDGFELRFTCEATDEGPVLGVLNSGSSIPPERREAVFDPFRRLDDQAGAGLGLSICRRIAERHAGRIWVESAEDRTHFRFLLSSEPL